VADDPSVLPDRGTGLPAAAPAAASSRWRTVVKQILVGAVFATYPVVVWMGAAAERPREVALLLLCVVLPVAIWLFRRSAANAARWLLLAPVLTVLGLCAAAVFDNVELLYIEPVAINLALLLCFGSTLRRGSVPMIERFARLQEATLSRAQLTWCRAWTVIWSCFFVLNGTTAAVLALAAPVAWWAWYNSVFVYVVMGVLFTTEWTIRRWRFHRG